MIKTLRLQNFKCFEDEPIHLSNLNLLTGLNGMGKSSVIQSLLLLRQNFENGLLHLNHRLGLNGDYTQIGNSNDILYRYFKKKEIGITFTYNPGVTLGWVWRADDNLDSLIEIANTNMGTDLSKVPLFTSNFHYLSAERIGPRPYYETSSTKVMHQNQLGVRGEFAANYFSVYREKKIPIENLKYTNRDANGNEADPNPSLYSQVNQWLSVIRPGAQARIKDQPEAGTITLQFEFLVSKDNPGAYRANNVGFGLTYVFPLILAVLASEPGTILLLENPEAHIHPKGQVELGILLARAAANGVQIIVETHSDHILNGVRIAAKRELITPEQVRLLFFKTKPEDDKQKHVIEYPVITNKGKIENWPKDFFDSWEYSMMELL